MENDQPLTYASYLSLDRVLGPESQKPLSLEHDEYLFIIMHQTKELWFSQILKDMKKSVELIENGDIKGAARLLQRITRIFRVMHASWDVLATLSKTEFNRFRVSFLASGASGVQSLQFRQIEFLLGIRECKDDRLKRQTDSRLKAILIEDLGNPTIWDAVNKALSAAGHDVPARLLNRDPREPYESDEAIKTVWQTIADDRLSAFHGLGQELLALAQALEDWRRKHIATVGAFIGVGPGSGGTEGVKFLKHTLVLVPFPELLAVRSKFPTAPNSRNR